MALVLLGTGCRESRVESGPGSVTGREDVWRASDAPARPAYGAGTTDFVRTDPNAQEPGVLESIGDLLFGGMSSDEPR